VWRHRIIAVWPPRVTSPRYHGMAAGQRGDNAQRAPQMTGMGDGAGAPSDKVSAHPCGVSALLRHGHRDTTPRRVRGAAAARSSASAPADVLDIDHGLDADPAPRRTSLAASSCQLTTVLGIICRHR
jgi:hypothetical protein